MIDIEIAKQSGLDKIVNNNFGEHYFFAVNRTVFQDTDASTVYRSKYGDSLFEEETFYVIAGTDSGLLFQYIKANGIPKGSRYLFVELPQILAQMDDLGEIENELVITTLSEWSQTANKMGASYYGLLGKLKQKRSLGVMHGHYSPGGGFQGGVFCGAD